VWLLQNGYEVFRSVSPFGAVDLVAIDASGSILLIDVTSTVPYKLANGEIRISNSNYAAKKRRAAETGVHLTILTVNPLDNSCKLYPTDGLWGHLDAPKGRAAGKAPAKGKPRKGA